MADFADANAHRGLWNPETLGDYEGKWIAFRKSFIASPLSLPNAPDLSVLLDQFAGEIAAAQSPIFAFVTFQVFA